MRDLALCCGLSQSAINGIGFSHRVACPPRTNTCYPYYSLLNVSPLLSRGSFAAVKTQCGSVVCVMKFAPTPLPTCQTCDFLAGLGWSAVSNFMHDFGCIDRTEFQISRRIRPRPRSGRVCSANWLAHSLSKIYEVATLQAVRIESHC